jgi:hypothetical protein
MSIGVLSLISKSISAHEAKPYHCWIGIISDFLLGLGLSLLSTMVVTDSADALGSSPWTLPLLCLTLLIALVLNHIPGESKNSGGRVVCRRKAEQIVVAEIGSN